MTAEVWSTTIDDFLGGAVKLRQPEKSYRAGSDTVLLAAAISAAPQEKILDVGCGVGGVALCLARRLPDVHVDALECQLEMAALARANADLNNLSDRIAIVEGNLAHPPKILKRGHYDQVVSNPPYLESGTATPPPSPSKARANVSADLSLDEWVAACVRFVKSKGRVTFIYRADRLHDLLAALAGRAGDVRVFPIWPKHGRAARRVIVTARRGLKGPLHLMPGLLMHEEDGKFTSCAEGLMRHGQGLDLWGPESAQAVQKERSGK